MTLPEGTVTFLRSDIEGSMELVRALGARYDELNAEQAAIVRGAIERHGGDVVRTEGDAFFAAFVDARGAAHAAVAIQRQVQEHAWPTGHRLRVRIGLHTGAAHRAGDDYGGFEVNRAARIAALGWGGQIILSDTARALIAADLPPGWAIRAIGRHRLKGVPEPELLFQLDVPGLPVTFPGLRSGSSASDRLPERVTPLIGRDGDLEVLGELLGRTRLLTLTGPGGTGKTSLAVELARRQAEGFEDGACLIDLQAVDDVDQVAAEIAHGVGLLDGATGPAADRLEGYLADRALLMVIDNFEQVISAAPVVGRLLADSPRSRAIVTSRRPLRLRIEQEFPVRPLAVVPGQDREAPDAERLFTDRAQRVRPGLEFDAAAMADIGRICRLVDGLPLAIELCAARVGSLPVRVILERLQAHQPLPGSAPQDLPDRQRTLERTVAWSYELLEPPQQRLYRRLAVFEESFDLAQAQQVCGPAEELGGDVLDGLVHLAEHSLLVAVDEPAWGARFRWLETLHSDALQRLQASEEEALLRSRHSRAFAGLATEAACHLPSAQQALWLDRLQSDDANLWAATRYALQTGDVEAALALVASLWRYWLQTGRLAEGAELTEQALALPGADAPSRLRIAALDAAGSIAYWSGEVDRADELYEEELRLARAIGDRAGEALALLDLFFTREFRGDEDGALAAREASMAIFRESGDRFGLARLEQSGFLILMARGLHDPEGYMSELEERAAEAEALADPWLSRVAPAFRAFQHLRQGDLPGAIARLVQALRMNLAVRERTDTALAMQFGVIVAPMLGRFDVAAEVHGAAQGAFEQLGMRAPASYEELGGVDPIPAVRSALGPAAFDEAVERGRRLSLEQAVDLIEAMGEAAA
jgi:predicted ATPase/class 3 adenylate cyclase